MTAAGGAPAKDAPARGAPFRCAIVGEGSMPTQCAAMLLRAGHQIVAVVSPDPTVRSWAAERGIRASDTSQGFVEFLRSAEFEYLFSIVNYTLLPAEVLSLPTRFAVNYHDGPLPAYAGVYVTSWALFEGEAMHGVTWHVMVEKVDAGDILQQASVEIAPRDTAQTLNLKCFYAGLRAFQKLIGELATGTEHRATQDLSRRSYFGLNHRPPSGAVIDWRRSASEIDRMIRALSFANYPNPIAVPKIALDGDFVVVAAMRPTGMRSSAAPGTVVAIDGSKFVVATGSEDVEIEGVHALDDSSALDLPATGRVHPGLVLPSLSEDDTRRLEALDVAAAKAERYWIPRLAAVRGHAFADSSGGRPPDESRGPRWRTFERACLPGDDAAGVIGASLAALGAGPSVRFSPASVRRTAAAAPGLFEPAVPLVAPDGDWRSATLAAVMASAERRGTYYRDVVLRQPALRANGEARAAWAQVVVITGPDAEVRDSSIASSLGARFALCIPDDTAIVRWHVDVASIDEERIAALWAQLAPPRTR